MKPYRMREIAALLLQNERELRGLAKVMVDSANEKRKTPSTPGPSAEQYDKLARQYEVRANDSKEAARELQDYSFTLRS